MSFAKAQPANQTRLLSSSAMPQRFQKGISIFEIYRTLSPGTYLFLPLLIKKKEHVVLLMLAKENKWVTEWEAAWHKETLPSTSHVLPSE